MPRRTSRRRKTQHLIDAFMTVLEDAHKADANLDDPIDRAMIASTLMRLVELELENKVGIERVPGWLSEPDDDAQ